MSTHLAAIAPGIERPFEVQSRPTPKPGPDELLVEIKSIALNPGDPIMRAQGVLVSTFPTILGFDIAGLVLEVGENVAKRAAEGGKGFLFQPRVTRIAAYAATVFKSSNPDYGAFQERCLVPWQHAVPLPDQGLSWNQAATLPVAVEVPLNAWDILGIPRLGEAQASQKEKRDVLLIWGASASVGTMGVQSARLLRDDGDSTFGAVYATAGAANQAYVKSLGADRVFDYKEPHLVESIVSAAKEDGLVIRHCFLATGQLAQCQAVLKAFCGEGNEAEGRTGKIASAPRFAPDMEKVNGVETILVLPAMADEVERLAQFQYWLGTWLRDRLANGSIRPSPEPKVVGKGVAAINAGVDLMAQGVSCTKLIIEIAE